MDAQSMMAQDRPISSAEEAASGMRDMQHKINEGQFSELSSMYEEAQRVVNYLEGALEAARTREHIIGGAMERLNAPTSPSPSLR